MCRPAIAFHHELRHTTRLVESDYAPQFAARSYALSVKGARHSINQDSYLTVDRFPFAARTLAKNYISGRSKLIPGDSLFLVADGCGEPHPGCRAGGLAMEVIAESLRFAWARFRNRGQPANRRQVLEALRVAFDRADQFVGNESINESWSPATGAAVTAACMYRGDLFVAHSGQTQALLWRAGSLHRLTHKPVVQGESSGPEDFPIGQKFGSSSQAPNGRTRIPVLLRALDLEPNDYLILFTGGLAANVTEHVISSTISSTPDPQRICKSLLAEARKHLIAEDLTVLVVRFALAHE